MKLLAKICFTALILTGLAGCTVDERPASETTVEVSLNLSADGWQTRAFTNDPVTHSVDRILVMPFVRTGLDDTPASFSPAMSQVVQYDVSTFEYEASLKLLRDETYKILILGYNSGDYDHNNPSGGSNKFEIFSIAQPSTLQNLILRLLEQLPETEPGAGDAIYYSCEIFSGFAKTGENDSFVATDDLTLHCELQRLQGGFSLELTDIPANVASITLNTTRLCSAIALFDGAPYTVSGFSTKPLVSITPSEGAAMFDIYLFPYSEPEFTIDIVYTDASKMTYPVTATDSETGTTLDNFPTVANRAYNLSGSYNDLKFVMTLGPSIGLDDNDWDGYN